MTKPTNPALILTLALPAFAIAASTGTAIVAFTRGDPTLPDEYHWEGMALDRDFADAQRASELNVRAVLHIEPTTHTCRIILNLAGTHPPALQLSLVHGARPEWDRQVRLTANSEAYHGQCDPLPPGQWHLKLADTANTWSVRRDITGSLDGLHIEAAPNPSASDVHKHDLRHSDTGDTDIRSPNVPAAH